MDLDSYELSSSVFDEMMLEDGRARPQWRDLYAMLGDLDASELIAIQDEVNRSFATEGITFTVYGDSEADERIIPVDCIPRILPRADWEFLDRGLRQRLRAINRFLGDVYGEGEIIKDGVMPAEMVLDCPQYRPQMRGYRPPHGTWVTVCGTDLVRTNDGFFVLEDNLRVPSGVSYMIANRKAAKSALRRQFRRHRVREVEHYGETLRTTLCELAPGGESDPALAVLTPGIYNSAFYEHMFLAGELGAMLVEGRDLLVDGGYVYARTTSGLKRIDVIYRRVDDDFLDPTVFRPDSLLGVPGLIHACRLGNVTLANAPGTGVADDKSVYAYVPEMIRYYLDEQPILANASTYLCRRGDDLAYTLENLDKLVVKRVGESGGYGMLVGPHATAQERREYAEGIKANPADFIAQPTLALSRSPCLIDGHLQARHVDLRPFVLCGATTRIVPGAFCRVALRRGSLVVNSSQGGGCKDLWVLEE